MELPKTVLAEAAKIAEKSGLSLNSWITRTIEQTLRDKKLPAEFFRRRAL